MAASWRVLLDYILDVLCLGLYDLQQGLLPPTALLLLVSTVALTSPDL